MRVLCLLAWLCWSNAAWAHPILVEPLEVELTEKALIVRFRPSAQVVRAIAGLPEQPEWSATAWEEAAARFGPYALAQFAVAADGQRLVGRVISSTSPSLAAVRAEPQRIEEIRGHWELHFDLPPRAPGSAVVVHLRHRMLREVEYSRGVRWQLSFVLQSRPSATSPWKVSLLPPEATFLLAQEIPMPPPQDPFQQ